MACHGHFVPRRDDDISTIVNRHWETLGRRCEPQGSMDYLDRRILGFHRCPFYPASARLPPLLLVKPADVANKEWMGFMLAQR